MFSNIPSHCYISVVQRLSVKHTMGVESCFQMLIPQYSFIELSFLVDHSSNGCGYLSLHSMPCNYMNVFRFRFTKSLIISYTNVRVFYMHFNILKSFKVYDIYYSVNLLMNQ